MHQVILFRDRDFGGPHKHVFVPNPNLAKDRLDPWDNQTSSIVVLEGQWVFYRDPDYKFVDGTLGPGLYPWVEAVGIKNDDISSLRPIYTYGATLDELLGS
jgi:Beta/Gamma crystallin